MHFTSFLVLNTKMLGAKKRKAFDKRTTIFIKAVSWELNYYLYIPTPSTGMRYEINLIIRVRSLKAA